MLIFFQLIIAHVDILLNRPFQENMEKSRPFSPSQERPSPQAAERRPFYLINPACPGKKWEEGCVRAYQISPEDRSGIVFCCICGHSSLKNIIIMYHYSFT
jgi:hypothetical protein